MALIVTLLTMIPAFALSTFVARRVPSAGMAYPAAIFTGIAALVVLMLVVMFWLSFGLLNISGPIYGVDQ